MKQQKHILIRQEKNKSVEMPVNEHFNAYFYSAVSAQLIFSERELHRSPCKDAEPQEQLRCHQPADSFPE